MLLGGLPGYLFFSEYFLVAVFVNKKKHTNQFPNQFYSQMFFFLKKFIFFKWIILLKSAHSASSDFVTRVKIIYVMIVAIVFAIWIALMITIFNTDGTVRNFVHQIEGGYASMLAFGGAIIFIIFGKKKMRKEISLNFGLLKIRKKGYKLYTKLTMLPKTSARTFTISNKILRLSILCTIAYLCRAIIMYSFNKCFSRHVILIFTFIKRMVDMYVNMSTLENIITQCSFQILFEA